MDQARPLQMLSLLEMAAVVLFQQAALLQASRERKCLLELVRFQRSAARLETGTKGPRR